MTTAARTTGGLTNKQGLPEPLVRAVEWSDRDRGGCDYTISELLRPARMAQLEREHADEVTEDAADRLWMVLGSAGHEVFRRSAGKSGIVEERAIVEVNGFKIGGQLDYAESDRTIFDYKFTSVYAAKEGPRAEWVQQLNCYRWLAIHYGVQIEKLQIVAIFRDWSKPRAAREQDYPQAQVKVFDIPLWLWDDTQDFIVSRISAHQSAKVALPECTADETWEKPEMWAVKKENGKRALKLHSIKENANLHAQSAFDLVVEHRPAERKRCEEYCRVSEFCEQFKAFKAANP